MPNHIKNKLEITGNSNQVNEVLNFLRGEQSEDGKAVFIDFNNIVPMPKNLDINSDGFISPLQNEFAVNTKFKEHIDSLRSFCKNVPSQKEKTLNNFLNGIRNYIEYGHASWRGWSIANWGTKWNAYEQEKPKNNILLFETAWGGVPNLIKKISEKFPDISFSYKWSDEDTGYNCGTGSYENGEETLFIPKNQSREAYELAFELRPSQKDKYKLVEGEYIYIEED